MFQAGAARRIAAAASLVVHFRMLLEAKLLLSTILLHVGAEMVELDLAKLVFEAALSVRIVTASFVEILAQVLDVGRVDV
jgi:hypothetical protein